MHSILQLHPWIFPTFQATVDQLDIHMDQCAAALQLVVKWQQSKSENFLFSRYYSRREKRQKKLNFYFQNAEGQWKLVVEENLIKMKLLYSVSIFLALTVILPECFGDCVWFDKCGDDPDYNDGAHELNCVYKGAASEYI